MAWFNSGTWVGPQISDFPAILSQLLIAINEREDAVGWTETTWATEGGTKARPTAADFSGAFARGDITGTGGRMDWLEDILDEAHTAINALRAGGITGDPPTVVGANPAKWATSASNETYLTAWSWTYTALTAPHLIAPWVEIKTALEAMRWPVCFLTHSGKKASLRYAYGSTAEEAWDAAKADTPEDISVVDILWIVTAPAAGPTYMVVLHDDWSGTLETARVTGTLLKSFKVFRSVGGDGQTIDIVFGDGVDTVTVDAEAEGYEYTTNEHDDWPNIGSDTDITLAVVTAEPADVPFPLDDEHHTWQGRWQIIAAYGGTTLSNMTRVWTELEIGTHLTYG